MSEDKKEDPRQPSREPIGYGAPFSLNNRLVLEAYKTDRALKAQTANGFAMVSQKVVVKGLKVLMDARLNDGIKTSTIIPRGSIAFIREEYLHTAPWAQKILQSEAVEGDFIIVDIQHIEFVKST